jgi:polysaccharide deacetylase family protein (PEP-CTERM system associated)
VPGGTLTNALTVDVEDYFHVSALAPSIPRDHWDAREPRVVGNTRKLLATFERFDVRGTFFVLGWVAERQPELVREIAARGHEIACHGFSHRLVYEQSPDEFREETRRAKQLLEDITGQAVLGYQNGKIFDIESHRDFPAISHQARMGDYNP